MQFDLKKSIEILERTPSVVEACLSGLSEDWVRNNEGENTWSPYDVMGHLIIGEKTDWMTRARIILSNSESKLFEPFDRFAQFNEDQNRSIDDLIQEFKTLRKKNLEELADLNITSGDLKFEGIHPEFGNVTLGQLIATWAVHDLGHIAQITRTMASQYSEEVEPWINYLGILKKQR